MTKIPDTEYQNIVAMFKSKERVKKIAAAYGVTKGTIHRILRLNGFDLSKLPIDDLTGREFGYLKVIKMAITDKSIGGRWRAICKCSNCGNDNFDVNPQALKHLLTTSCGCRKDQYEKISGKNNTNFTGHEGIRGQQWTLLKKRAASRGQAFNLTIQEAWEVYVKQNKKCAISGLPIAFGVMARTRKEVTASLDRINSKKGYSKDNVQWVHKDVNIMKNMFDQKYFIGVCTLIAQNNKTSFKVHGRCEDVIALKTDYFGDKMRNMQ